MTLNLQTPFPPLVEVLELVTSAEVEEKYAITALKSKYLKCLPQQ
jgi:hypothetical protein